MNALLLYLDVMFPHFLYSDRLNFFFLPCQKANLEEKERDAVVESLIFNP